MNWYFKSFSYHCNNLDQYWVKQTEILNLYPLIIHFLRKKAKAAGMFKNLVKGAKRGAAKGKGHRPGQAMRKMKK